MSTGETSCSTDSVLRRVTSTPYLTSLEDLEPTVKEHSIQPFRQSLQNFAKETLECIVGGKGPSFDSLKSLATFASDLNQTISEEFFRLREKKEMVKIADVLGDEYMKMSSHMLDFLHEIEKFLMRARKSHSYVKNEIEKYWESDKRDADRYWSILNKLKNLKSTNDIYEYSADSILEKADTLKRQHEEMLNKLQVEMGKLAKKEETARFWKKFTSMIFIGAVVTVAIGGIVLAGVATAGAAVSTIPVIVTTTISAIGAISGAGVVTVSMLDDLEIQYKKMWEENMSRCTETRVAIKALGDIKSFINDVIKMISSLTFQPSAEMDQEDIDFSMNEIKKSLATFLNSIEVLDNQVKTCKGEVQKARDRVLVEQKTSERDRVMAEQKTSESDQAKQETCCCVLQ